MRLWPGVLLSALLVLLWWCQRPALTPPQPAALGSAAPGFEAQADPVDDDAQTADLLTDPELDPDPMAGLRQKIVTLRHDFNPSDALAAALAWPNVDGAQMYGLAEGIEFCSQRGGEEPGQGDMALWLAHCKNLPAAWREKPFLVGLKEGSAQQGYLLAQLMRGFEVSYQADMAGYTGQGPAYQLRGQAIGYFEAAARQGSVMALAVLAAELADPDNGEFYQPVRALAYVQFLKALLPGFSAPGLEGLVADLPYYDQDAADLEVQALAARWQLLDTIWR
ncbi:hypothetical protein [Gallaecimonas xiamenensis]|uniref:Uncharacterized protein n=1 Tax=Gallaecimonas xiamenensis 3-C-1 TaxID=745411 RepID=K2K1Q7_9GAMM|nr:hypothetical protein [Gallaecimonas xiamenensis]EKE76744.1 hypothetical protein B3C1_04085 [Gallaecimonas xiamenensis 3-C-1]